MSCSKEFIAKVFGTVFILCILLIPVTASARFYGAVAGKFTSRDPIGEEGGLNEYAYVENNPINENDPLGLAPGDSYPSQNAAAKQGTADINPRSIREQVEYGGMVYRLDSGKYSYTKPNRGVHKGVDPGGDKACPAGKKATAFYHTHGEDDKGHDNENFSTPDRDYADRNKIDGYLGTPKGYLKKYRKGSHKVGITIGRVPVK